MTAQCLISFGSNLGHRDELIGEAARRISQSAQIRGFATSRLFETPPIGGPSGQDTFLNAVAAFETVASARQILDLLQTIEEQLGRQRRSRWDSRSIDLDVVLHGELMGGGTGLIVPHPRYTARQFVLKPAIDVAAEYRDPRFDWNLRRLAEHLDAGLPSMALVGGDAELRHELCEQVRQGHGIQTLASRPPAESMEVIGNAPASIRHQQTSEVAPQKVVLSKSEPWISEFLPILPETDSSQCNEPTVPRLVARIQRTAPDHQWPADQSREDRWPAPHQMWPSGWRWPEYRLEVDDLQWAASELASALASMRCSVVPVTDDREWWKKN